MDQRKKEEEFSPSAICCCSIWQAMSRRVSKVEAKGIEHNEHGPLTERRNIVTILYTMMPRGLQRDVVYLVEQ